MSDALYARRNHPVRTVILETMRRQLTSGLTVVFLSFIALIGLIVGAANGPARIWQGFLFLIVILLSCQLIGPEFSSGTLQLILAKPIRRSTYLVARVLGMTFTLWIMIGVPFVLDLGARAVFPDDDVAWLPLIAQTANVALSAILVASLMAFFGSFSRSYLNAAMYFGLQAVLSLVAGLLQVIEQGLFRGLSGIRDVLRDNPWIQKGLAAVSENLYPTAPDRFSREFTLLVLCNAAAAVTLACLIFRRREVPYGAD